MNHRNPFLMLLFLCSINASWSFAGMTDSDAAFSIQPNSMNGMPRFNKAGGQAEFDQSGFNYGLTGELNGTFIVHQQTYGKSRLMPYSPSIKFAFRAMVGYNFDPSEGIVVGLGYCGGGQNYHDTWDGTTYSKNVSLNYLQVPIMFKYVFNTDAIQTYAMAGIQLGFLSSSSITINDTIMSPNTIAQAASKTSSFFQSSDIGFRFEVGDDFMLQDNLYFNAGIQSYIGLPDINSNDFRKEFTFRGNKYTYKKSSNFIIGFEVGIHYLIK